MCLSPFEDPKSGQADKVLLLSSPVQLVETSSGKVGRYLLQMELSHHRITVVILHGIPNRSNVLRVLVAYHDGTCLRGNELGTHDVKDPPGEA